MSWTQPPRRREAEATRLLQGDPLTTYPAHRVCAKPDCGARLSRYNPSAVCGEHNGWRDEPSRRRRRAPHD